MSLSFAHDFDCQVYVKSGTQTRENFAAVQKVAAATDHNLCCGLLGLHSFTACDTVSPFAGKGKISAFMLMQKNRKYQGAFTRPGKKWSVPRDLSSVLQEFTCKLYATRCPCVANYSEPRKERSSQDGFLLVKIASSCTVKLECGALLLKSVVVSPTQVAMDGAMKMAHLQFAGGQGRLPQRLSQSSYLATAPPFASRLTASASPMD